MTGREVEIGSSFLFGKTEIGQFARGTKLAVAQDLGRDGGQIVSDSGKSGPYFQRDVETRGNRSFEFDFQVGGHARSLQLAGHKPPRYLVDEQGLYATVQGVQPPLIVFRWSPKGDDVVTVFIKLHFQPVRIVRRTANAVVSLFFKPYPGIYDFFHCR